MVQVGHPMLHLISLKAGARMAHQRELQVSVCAQGIAQGHAAIGNKALFGIQDSNAPHVSASKVGVVPG